MTSFSGTKSFLNNSHHWNAANIWKKAHDISIFYNIIEFYGSSWALSIEMHHKLNNKMGLLSFYRTWFWVLWIFYM